MTRFATHSGFSLVELSIVLVILGLLTGGILTGQNLIRAAELRSVVTEFQTYQTAIHTFRDKNLQLPGDITNATDFWGAPGSSLANCPATVGTGTETCNGDGDGIVEQTNGADEYNEWFMIFQHLSNASMITGTYTGRSGPDGPDDGDIGINLPPSRISNAGWSADNPLGSPTYFTLDYTNSLVIGSQTAGNNQNQAPVFTPEEAWNIDTKVDDGKPARGFAVVNNWANCTTALSATEYDAEYDFSNSAIDCSLLFPGAIK